MKNKVIKEKKDSDINVPGLIIAMILLIGVCVGGFFLGRWMISQASTKKDDDTAEVKATTDRLLKLLNDNITKTKVGEETLANEVTSFSYNEKHFYISGYNGSTVYQYDVDLTSKSFTNTKEALDFLKDNDVDEYDIGLNRCTPTESNDFVNKYVTEGVTGKYHIATYGTDTYAYATLLKDQQITIINGAVLSDTLNSSYSPITISNSDPLFKVYSYLATR